MSDAWRTILTIGGVLLAGLLIAALTLLRRPRGGRPTTRHRFDTWGDKL